MSKSSQSEKLKQPILIRERLHPLSAQMLQEVVGGQAHSPELIGSDVEDKRSTKCAEDDKGFEGVSSNCGLDWVIRLGP